MGFAGGGPLRAVPEGKADPTCEGLAADAGKLVFTDFGRRQSRPPLRASRSPLDRMVRDAAQAAAGLGRSGDPPCDGNAATDMAGPGPILAQMSVSRLIYNKS